MGSGRVPDVVLEAICRFHECSVRSQIEERKLLNLSSSLVYNAIDTSRKRLGRSLLQLIRTCVAEPLRHQRDFRVKYTEDFNLTTLEEGLISTANKVLDLASTDRSFLTIRPIARTFLVSLATVQTQVASVVDALAKLRGGIGRRNRRALFRKASSAKATQCRSNSSPSQLPFFVEAVSSGDDYADNRNLEQRSHHTNRTASLLSASASPSLPILPTGASYSTETRYDDLDEILTTLIGLLIEVDHDMAIFEFALVSSISRRLRTEAEADAVQEVAVLFSETLVWALSVGLVDTRQLSERDPLLFLALPRLAVLVGCHLLPDSPIGPNRLNSGARPPFMFAESTRELAYLSRQLAVLRADQLWRLACWTSPFGLSEAETRNVDAATANATAAAASLGKCSTTRQPSSLVMVGWNTYGLHCIYKCIARVAGNLSTYHPSEYRDILQLAIELHDPSSSHLHPGLSDVQVDPKLDSVNTEEEGNLQPICPLDDEAAMGCLREGRIHNIRLADLFDWHSVVADAAKRPFADLFYRPGEEKKGGKLKSMTSPESPLEVGIDVVACLEDEDGKSSDEGLISKKGCFSAPLDTSENASTTRSILLAFLRSAPIEDTAPAAPPNPLYPLAPWQPDRFVGTGLDTNTDNIIDTDIEAEGDETETSMETRLWRSGAPRVGRECARCKARFLALLRRRHHCRRCGHIFCAACCSERAPVAALMPAGASRDAGGVEMVRVCVECAEFVRSGLAETLDQAVISF